MTSERNGKKISTQTVERLSLYRKILEGLHNEGVTHVYSHQLAKLVAVTPAQLRRDLASFGSFGNISKGYNVYQMILTLSRLLGTDTIQPVALIGMGNLGRAILAYRGFEERGFHIAVVFDVDSEKVGRVFAGRRCFHIKDLETVLPDYQPTIAILACSSQGLQSIVDRLGKAGVRGIVNFVPKKIHPLKDMHVEDVDISDKMEKLSFLLRSNKAG
ncbi:MAG: Redox-sensing transcriptional repressor rex [Deltaproteobacteria bacterium]|nr:Redox-sensing transcriptional repressor rex [Deltaproteobacteria bacterium]